MQLRCSSSAQVRGLQLSTVCMQCILAHVDRCVSQLQCSMCICAACVLYLSLQLYNEDINDLLAPENLKLPIHESKENGVYVAGLREDIVVSTDQVLELIKEGEANRHIGATKMNEGSSRSHTVFRMVRDVIGTTATGWDAAHACRVLPPA